MVTTRQMRKRKPDDDDEEEIVTVSASPNATESKRQRKLPVRTRSPANSGRLPADEEAASEAEPTSRHDSSLVVEIRAKGDEDDGAEDEAEIESDKEVGEGELAERDDGVQEVGRGASVTDNKAAPASSATAEIQNSDSDSDSDSDEAPEAVSTATAAAQAIKSAKAANKAVAEQEKSQKRKRQQRTARLQEQAQGRKAQRLEVQTSQLDGVLSAPAGEEQHDITPRTQLSREFDAAASTAGDSNSSHRKVPKLLDRKTKAPLPAMLPAQYLDSDSEDSDAEAEHGHGLDGTRKPHRKARKISTAERSLARQAAKATRPRDTVVGSTLYRAAGKKQDPRLAPKGVKDSMKAKQALLMRGRTGGKPNKRFFVK